MDRREFLNLTAIAGASLMAAPLWSAAAVSSSEKLIKGKMKTRKLGNLEVSEIGLGCMNMANKPRSSFAGPAVINFAPHDDNQLRR